MTGSGLTIETWSKWTFPILVSDSNCPVCGQRVLNHDDYTLIVRYPNGDEMDRKGSVLHTDCRSILEKDK